MNLMWRAIQFQVADLAEEKSAHRTTHGHASARPRGIDNAAMRRGRPGAT